MLLIKAVVCRHAKRSTITMDDVKLLVRRNESLVRKFDYYCIIKIIINLELLMEFFVQKWNIR